MTPASNNTSFTNVIQFIQTLGIGKTKFYKLLKQQNLPKPGGLLSPEMQNFYRKKLGFPPLWETP